MSAALTLEERRKIGAAIASDYEAMEKFDVRTRCDRCNKRIPIRKILNGLVRQNPAQYDTSYCKRADASMRRRERERDAKHEA